MGRQQGARNRFVVFHFSFALKVEQSEAKAAAGMDANTNAQPHDGATHLSPLKDYTQRKASVGDPNDSLILKDLCPRRMIRRSSSCSELPRTNDTALSNPLRFDLSILDLPENKEPRKAQGTFSFGLQAKKRGSVAEKGNPGNSVPAVGLIHRRSLLRRTFSETKLRHQE